MNGPEVAMMSMILSEKEYLSDLTLFNCLLCRTCRDLPRRLDMRQFRQASDQGARLSVLQV